MTKEDIIRTCLLVIIGMGIGFAGAILMAINNITPFESLDYEHENGDCSYIFDGCWASVQAGKNTGNWICVNIKNMSWERAVDVCEHEVGHEMFARSCEKNITKCMSNLN
jgi:hypothetical protein